MSSLKHLGMDSFLWDHAYLWSHYSAIALVYLLISWVAQQPGLHTTISLGFGATDLFEAVMPRACLALLTNNDIIIQYTFTPSLPNWIFLLQILLQVHAIYVTVSVTDHISQLHKISHISNLCILIFSGVDSKRSNQFCNCNKSITWIYSSLTFMVNINFLFSHIMKHYQMIYVSLLNTCYADQQTLSQISHLLVYYMLQPWG